MKKIKLFTAAMSVIMAVSAVSCGQKNDEVKKPKPFVSEEEPTRADGKTVITIGMPGANNYVIPDINDFNASNKEYFIEVKNYAKDLESGITEDKKVSELMNMMNLDLLGDDVPDILALHPTYMIDFVNKGVFTDMYELMDSLDGVKREDFLPNVLKGFEVGGKIPAISNGWIIETAAAKESVVGKESENWTPQQAKELFSNMPDDSYFLHDSGDYVANFFTHKSARDCIDLKNMTCDFKNDDFISNLKFVQGTRKDMDDSSFWDMLTDNPYPMKNNKTLVSEVRIGGMSAELGSRIWSDFFGEDIVYTGYPSTNGKSYSTSVPFVMFGITEKSANKEAAWKFINYMLSAKVQKENNYCGKGLPVTNSILDELASEENGGSKKYISNTCIRQTYPHDGSDTHIPDELIQQACDYIRSVEFEPYFSFTLDMIVDEEIQAVLAGDKTPEECADILQNRISIYLSEKS